jgi:cytochrome c-type biogenesis protein CcmH/NrfF
MTTDYLLLWAAPVGGLLIALVIVFIEARRRRR